MIAAAATAASLLSFVALAPHAAAVAGWSRSPAAGIAGATVRVASSPTALCQWLAPGPPTAEPTTATTVTAATVDPASATADGAPTASAVGDPIPYDGSRVELRLDHAGASIPLGHVAVGKGGAWAGSVSVPDTASAPAGGYDLIARCVVDDPALDGVRSFDFDPLPFVVADAPPPTTVTIPTEIGEPVTITKPTQVEGTQLARPNTAAKATAAAVPTLPNTGDGTLAVALAGIGALLLGGLALWWGSRAGRERAPV
ncbi:MAG: LPXTG cell wall anchor domain-containing protein [Acidimicrobiia bacterium]